jgi:Bifunctional DNA primase/polymerase, N-terminal/AAA domain
MVSPHDANLRYALRCSEFGLSVFPCADKQTPLVKWRAQSTTDPDAIKQMWARWPNALPAIDLAKSGHVVVDADRHGGPDGVAAVEQLFTEHNTPLANVPGVITPGNGVHCWFRQPNGKPLGNSDKPLRDLGINIRGAGGYVIAPGAQLPDGRGYTRDKDTPNLFAALRDNAVPPLPEWLAELLRPQPTPKLNQPAPKLNGDGHRHQRYAEAALEALCNQIAGTAEGSRNIELNNAALRMGHMVASGWIEQAIVERRLGDAAFAAGLSADEISKTLASGINAGLQEPHPELADRPQNAKQNKDDSKPDVSNERPEAIALSYFSDLKEAAPKLWLVKNVIARGETSGWIGPPGAGKSAALGDLCVHGASSSSWRGYRIKQQFGSLYLALERADLVKRRFTAQRMRDNLPIDLPIAIAGQVIDLMDRNCVADILDAIKRAEDRLGCEIGLLTIDTYAKGIAAGGGDESTAKDQNIAIANLRRVLDKVNIHIATAGRTGKDVSRGERGSNAKLADVDLQVQISGESIKTAIVVKGNDQPLGTLTSFQLEPYDFGPDEDGDPFRTYILSRQIIEASTASKRSLNPKQQLAMEALAEVTLSHGIGMPATDGLPAGLKSVTADRWRDELCRRQILDRDTKNLRARYTELRDQLAAKHLIGVRDELVWLAKSRGNSNDDRSYMAKADAD